VNPHAGAPGLSEAGSPGSQYPIPGLEEVPGFLTPEAAALLHDIGARQRRAGIAGDIAELGVFYGRSALVLGLCLAGGERLHACDRFAVGARDVPGWQFDTDEEPEAFLRAWWDRWAPDPSALVVHRGDSRRLDPVDLGAPARLIHVDAGHEYEDVLGDLRLASAALHPLGAIVADDVLLPEWPDVTVALIDHLRAPDADLVPVAIAQHKAVLCRPDAAGVYRDWLLDSLPAAYPPPAYLCVERSFDGVPVQTASRVQDAA
jgi:hypothetical protein